MTMGSWYSSKMNGTGRGPQARRWPQRLALMAFSLLVSFGALECYARLTFENQWQIPREVVQPPGVYSLRMKADAESDLRTMDGTTFHVRTNPDGFRGPTVASLRQKPLRVISLGDSYMFGWGVELQDQAMARAVSRYAAAHPAEDLGHAWVATVSWDPRDYYFAYREFAAAAKPQLVVVGLFTGNDVMPSDGLRTLERRDLPVVSTIPERPVATIRSIDWLRAELSSSPLVARLRARQAPASYAMFDKDLASQQRVWDTTFFYLRALQDAVAKDGGTLVVVLYPSMLQVATPEALREAGYDADMPEKVMTAFAHERQLTLITLLDGLRAGNGNHDLFFSRDRHLTTKGHAIASGIVLEQLTPVLHAAWEKATAGAAWADTAAEATQP